MILPSRTYERLDDAKDKAGVKQEFLDRVREAVPRVISGKEKTDAETDRRDDEDGPDIHFSTKEDLDIFGQPKPKPTTKFSIQRSRLSRKYQFLCKAP